MVLRVVDVSPDNPIGEPAIVVPLDDQVVIEQIILGVGTKKEQKELCNSCSDVNSKSRYTV
jgi:hypothetical protein